MNKIVIGVIAFAAGAGIGTGITYAVCKSKLEKRYNKLERKLHKQYDIMMKRIDEAPVIERDYTDVVKESEWVERDISNMSKEDQKEFYMHKIQDLGYTVGEYDLDEDDEVNPIDDEDDDESPEEHSDKISLLNYNEFVRIDTTDLKTMSFTYYSEDKTITDDKDNIVPEWRNLIGDEWIDVLNNKNHTCFILNRDAGIVADIEFIEGSYKDIVEGVSSDE